MTTGLHPLDNHDRSRWPAPFAGMLAVGLVIFAIIGLLVTLVAR